MSIFERTGQKTRFDSPEKRLSLFADRHELQRLFLRKLHGGETSEPIVFLHGMGGAGKSSLLRYLQARCCVELSADEWRALDADRTPAALERLREVAGERRIASALIDFGARPVGQQRPLEALPALFMLKRQLAPFGIRTPRFDFAAVNYLEKSGLAYRQILPELFPANELNLATEIADAVSGLPVLGAGRALLQILDGRTGHAFGRWRLARTVEDEQIRAILDAPADPELADRLPYYFALDVNAWLASARTPRLALLCDTHEAFWGEDAFPTAAATSLAALARDKWLRTLLGSVDLGNGAVAVVAGRNPPRWDAAEEDRIPDRFVDLRHVRGLPPADARWYLEHVGIEDPEAQRIVVGYASGPPDEVHPYMLGLCTDVLASQAGDRLELDAAADLDARRRRLVARLMSSVSEEMQRRVVAVAACRAFDYDTFAHLGRSIGFPHTLDDFRRLVTYSFMLESAGETFAAHQLLRRELAAMFEHETRAAHAVLVEFHGAREDPASQAEAALHLALVDPEAGVARWCAAIDVYLGAGRFSEAQAFTSVVPELPASTPVYYRVAQAHLGRGAVAEARALYAQLPPDAVEAILLRADLEFYDCKYADAERTARDGLARVAGDDRERLQLRLAEILLYRGDFAATRDVLAAVGRWGLTATMLTGEVELFAGNLAEAERRFAEGRAAAVDPTALGWALAGTGLIHLVRREWDEAYDAFAAALERRDAASHGRGIANSLLLMGRARCGAGSHHEGRRQLARAARLAHDQGDDVTLAKVRRAEAMSHFAAGELDAAEELLAWSLEAARAGCVPYDVAHVLLDAAIVRGARGDDRGAVAAREEARRLIARNGFGLLKLQYPDPLTAAIQAGLTGFAIGDAVGAPWEGRRPEEVSVAAAGPIPRREDWPAGATTDDTDQLLSASEALLAPPPAAERLLRALAARLPAMRGFGPTTPAAVRRFLADGSLQAAGGTTNGALMRAPAVGWAVAPSDPARRRELVDALTRTTHGAPEALAGARVVAALAAWALEGVSGRTLAEVALEELAAAGLPAAAGEPIRTAAAGRWAAPAEGVSMEALDTVAAVVAIVREHAEFADAVLASVRLGGDTDSVAALAGALLACRQPEARLRWREHVLLPAGLDTLAAGLAALREAGYA